MKIHVGDQVIVTTGKDKGKTGAVLKFDRVNNKVQVAGVNEKTRHIKAREGQAGDRIKFFAPVHASNIALIDPKSGKATRVGFDMKGGQKTRIARASGQPIVKTKAAKPAKAVTKASKKEPNVIEA